MLLSVQNLACARGGATLLSGLNFELDAGEALILRGGNGIGKTTLLRTLVGLQAQVEGDVTFEPETAAFASHADGVKSTLSVVENLTFWAEIYKASMPEEIYDQFDLVDLKDRLAGTLSAGQKRRLGLARLAVINRKILFLDEPTVSLDRFSVQRFESFLRDKHLARGGCAVIATHVDIDIGARTLELAPFQSNPNVTVSGDEAFL